MNLLELELYISKILLNQSDCSFIGRLFKNLQFNAKPPPKRTNIQYNLSNSNLPKKWVDTSFENKEIAYVIAAILILLENCDKNNFRFSSAAIMRFTVHREQAVRNFAAATFSLMFNKILSETLLDSSITSSEKRVLIKELCELYEEFYLLLKKFISN